MKRMFVLAMCLLLAFSINAFAKGGNPHDELSEDIQVSAEIGPYAHVMAQRLQYDHSQLAWGWLNFCGLEIPVPGMQHYWSDEEDPLMDFGKYSGAAGQGKFTDSNGFVVETNTSLQLVFSGIPLTHTQDDTSRMLTTYWAFTAEGVDSKIWPVPDWRLFPAQVRPKTEIGYFGIGGVPRFDSFEIEHLPEDILALIGTISASGQFFPKQDLVEENREYNGITEHGIYAFQVFGFASTDEISSQREGNYEGKIILTVSKQASTEE